MVWYLHVSWYDASWCFMVFYSLMCHGMIPHDVLCITPLDVPWYDTPWYVMVLYFLMCHGMTLPDMSWYDTSWCVMVWYLMMCCGMIPHNVAWYDTLWCAVAWYPVMCPDMKPMMCHIMMRRSFSQMAQVPLVEAVWAASMELKLSLLTQKLVVSSKGSHPLCGLAVAYFSAVNPSSCQMTASCQRRLLLQQVC